MSTDAVRQHPQEYVAAFPLHELEAYPGNPKDHDIGLIDESLDENGWYGAIVAQRRKWTPDQQPRADGSVAHKARVLVGHGRKDTMMQKGERAAPVLLIDCGDDVAQRIVSVDNRASEKGGYNTALLLDFLKPLAELGGLRGTGYDGDDVDDLAALLRPFDFGPPAEPSSSELPYKPHETILVHVKSIEQHTAVTKAIGDLIAANPQWEAKVVTR